MAKVAQLSVIKGVGSPVQEFVFFPQTSLGELTALPRSLAGKGDGIGGEGEGKGREGREWRGRKGKQWKVASS